jgi:hypothetical protein
VTTKTEQRVGQVWRWTIGADDLGDYDVDELYLILWPEPLGPEWAHLSLPSHVMWSALNLATGKIEFVTPEFTAGDWELL